MRRKYIGRVAKKLECGDGYICMNCADKNGFTNLSYRLGL